MGSGTNYRAGDARHWEVTRTVGGHKVLRQIKGSLVNNLPTYSETSDFYLKENAQGEITQMRVYVPCAPLLRRQVSFSSPVGVYMVSSVISLSSIPFVTTT